MAMTRRQIMLPDELWSAAQRYAIARAGEEKRQISTAEAIRRLVEIGLKEEENKHDRD